MANILNIDTSSKYCSVAMAQNGEVAVGYESREEMDHSKMLAPFIEKCLNYLRENRIKLDAVAVSAGPGSYTGLRIGLSMAKGIAFGMEIPLISISSLEIMAARAIFCYPEFKGDEIIVPMVDARRMEVYTGVYDSSLKQIKEETPLILQEDSLEDLKDFERVIFIGDGTEKFKGLYKFENAIWLGDGMPHAKYMAPLSEMYYRQSKFADLAYQVPNYLKEYQTTVAKTILTPKPHNKK